MCNTETGGHKNRSDKNKKKKEKISVIKMDQRIRINYFTKKKNEW